MTPTELRVIDCAIDTFEQAERRRRVARYMVPPAVAFLGAFVVSLSTGSTHGLVNVRTTSTAIIPGGDMAAWTIFLHNARILVTILIGGTLTFTLVTFVLLLVNAIHFASGVGFLLRSYGEVTAIAAFAPHGVFEVLALLVAASVSLRMSVLLSMWRVFGRGTDIGRATAAELAALTALAFALIGIAAVVETTLTVAVVTLVG